MKNNNRPNIIRILLRTMLLIVLIAIVVMSSMYAAYTVVMKDDTNSPGFINSIIGKSKEKEEKIYVLLMGVREGLTDTIILAQLDPNTNKVAMLSIPRDTYVENTVDHKINSAYGGKHPEKTIACVKTLTGIEADYYAIVDLALVRKVVDAVGGVEIDVKTNMYYTDPAQKLYINLKKGVQVLDGKKAEQFVRFRSYLQGDVTRVEAQQQFIKALIDTALQPKNITKIPEFINIFFSDVQTDIGLTTALKYVDNIKNIDMENLTMQTLPGEGKYIGQLSYFVHDKEETKKVVEELFLKEDVNEIEGGEAEGTNISYKVEVLNGSSNENALNEVVSELTKKGYYVIKVGMAESTQSTKIINKTSDEQSLKKLKEVLSTTNAVQEEKEDDIDYTIIIGNDFENKKK